MTNKVKVTEKPEIVVHGTAEKPYFEIKYKELGKTEYTLGYSSFYLSNCFDWLESEFEVVGGSEMKKEEKQEIIYRGAAYNEEKLPFELRSTLCRLRCNKFEYCSEPYSNGCEKLLALVRARRMEMNGLAYKEFCSQNLEEVVRDHDNKGYINFAVDFDGVLCKSAYPEIGEPNLDMIHYLIEQREKGNKIILWTSRTDEDLQAAIDWCADYGLGFDFVNEGDPVVEKMYGTPGKPTRKIYADVYIDDRNMATLNIWPVQYSEEEVEVSDLKDLDGKMISEMSADELYRVCVRAMIKVEKGQNRLYYLSKLLSSEKVSDIAAVDLTENKTVHKASHYQNGAFEVIDEMIITFGADAAITFCRLNAWKYRARAAYKGKAEEDMKKSNEYLKMAYEIMRRRSGPFGTAMDNSLCFIGDRE